MLRRTPAPSAGRRLFAILAGLSLLLVLSVSLVAAQDIRFFRIGTGSTAGTYFPVGGIIASAISSPPGSRDCERGGSCGVPGLVAVAQSTRGSVDNVRQIRDGSLESGFSQSDVAFWAFNGQALFEEEGAMTGLRAIANLYPETLHLVVRFDSGIKSIADIKGKRISLDRKGSGTRVDALLVLKAFGISEDDLQVEALGSGAAADALREAEIDGFFFVAGTPAVAVQELAEEALVELLPIGGEGAERLLADYPFFAKHVVAAGTYPGIGETETISVGAQWLVSESVPEEIVYQITRSLWHPSTRQLLDKGHPKGQQIVIEQALEGLGVPLHPGAERYYQETGALQPGP